MQVVSDSLQLVGYHGTNEENVDLINKDSFKKSVGETQWFGVGCYFFTEGLSDPKEMASLWVIDQAWDKSSQKYKYTKWVVLKTTFEIDNSEILDLRTEVGLRLFNQFRTDAIKNILSKGKIAKNSYKDQDVFSVMKKIIRLKVIIGNVYIKFGEVRKEGQSLKTFIPNVTMFCIDNSDGEYIELQNTINLVSKGDIIL
ncbi:MAG: hypothetical protein ACTHMI_11380 [Mucilaginibacter sp.]